MLDCKCMLLVALSAFGFAVVADSRINVRTFGAKGDGTTDDSAAFQKAFDMVRTLAAKDRKVNGQGWDYVGVPAVFVPAGEYRISRPLLAPSAFFLEGEDGSVLRFDQAVDVGVYVERAFRVAIQNLKFCGGLSHVSFWTANEDTASVLVENCAFEGCANEAIWTESWCNKVMKTAKDVEAEQFSHVCIGPYDVKRDESGMPVLSRPKRENRWANSTRFGMHNCTFIDCGAAYRGACDATSIDHVEVRSGRVQGLPIWSVGGKVRMTDVHMLANIPGDYNYAWLEINAGQVDVMRVCAKSSSGFGAPLFASVERLGKERIWGDMACVGIEDCMADVAGSKDNALVVFRKGVPAIAEVRKCREARRQKIDLFKFGLPMERETDLLRAFNPSESNRKLPVSLAHRWLVRENGAEIVENVPAIVKPYLQAPVPESVIAEFPSLDKPVLKPNNGPFEVFDAEDFGVKLANERKTDESDSLQRLFDVAAKSENPQVILPGRSIWISKTLAIPRRVKILGAGRPVIRCESRDVCVFKVADGEAPLAIPFDGIVIDQGGVACEAEGEGDILFRNGGLAFNMGFKVTRRGGPLRLEGRDVTVRGPRFAESRGADVRLKDSWTKYSPEEKSPSLFLVNGGTLVCESVLGTPITGKDPFKVTRLPWLKEDEHAYWIVNKGGVVRTRHYLYGPEFGGLGMFDNYDAGKVLIERNQAGWGVSPSSFKSAFRNRDPAGTVVVSTQSLIHECYPGLSYGGGVKPGRYYNVATRALRDNWEATKE